MHRLRRSSLLVAVAAGIVLLPAAPAHASPGTAEGTILGSGTLSPGVLPGPLGTQAVSISGQITGTFVGVGANQATFGAGTLPCQFNGGITGIWPFKTMTLEGGCAGVAANGVGVTLRNCTLTSGFMPFLPPFTVLNGTCDQALDPPPLGSGPVTTSTLTSTLSLAIAPTSTAPTTSFSAFAVFFGEGL